VITTSDAFHSVGGKDLGFFGGNVDALISHGLNAPQLLEM
jgi:hypothetical protein